MRIDTQKTVYPVYGIFVAVNKDGKIFAGGANASSDYGVYYSENNGVSWTYIKNGYRMIDNQAKLQSLFAASDGHLFAGTNVGLFRSVEKTTGIVQTTVNTPKEFSLDQNYPNPFNPGTNIRFSIPKSAYVTLKVFDVLGKEVAQLVNENLNAGTYNYNFEASKLSSGVYLYRITVYSDRNQADNFTETRKMILTK